MNWIHRHIAVAETVKQSFKSWHTHWPSILLSVLIDLVFILCVSTVVTLIQFTLFDHLEAIMKMTGESTGGLMNIYNQTDQVTMGLSSVTNTGEFQFHMTQIVKYLGIMVLSVFVFWAVFQALSWFVAYRASTDEKKRQPFLLFWKNFALESVPFYLLTVFWIFISVRLVISAKMSIAPWMGESVINAGFITLVLATWYFGTLCYTMISKSAYSNFKQAFVYGVKKFPNTIQSFLLILILFTVIDFILKLPFLRGDAFLLAVVGTLLFLPTLFFARILLFRTAETHWKADDGAGKAKAKPSNTNQ